MYVIWDYKRRNISRTVGWVWEYNLLLDKLDGDVLQKHFFLIKWNIVDCFYDVAVCIVYMNSFAK